MHASEFRSIMFALGANNFMPEAKAYGGKYLIKKPRIESVTLQYTETLAAGINIDNSVSIPVHDRNVTECLYIHTKISENVISVALAGCILYCILKQSIRRR